jgi:transposase
VLLAAAGLKNTEIAERLGINRAMAAKWRSRFAEHRLDGLTDEPRPGRPRSITDEQVDAVITKTLESTPRDATHWSTRSMANEVGLTQTAVSRIWRAFGLQPHRQDSFKLSKDPLLSRRSMTSSGSISTARARRRALRRREIPDPGAGSHPADPADARRDARARHA